MKQLKQTPAPVAPTPETQPYRIMNLNFASRKTFTDFCSTSLLIIIIPVVSVLLLNNWVKDNNEISQLGKVLIAVGPAVIFINLAICTYAVRAMKNPENYQRDPPLKLKPKTN